MRRLVLVGEGPNPTEQRRLASDPTARTHPLYGSPARVLSVAAGWAPHGSPERFCYKELYRRARLFNLCSMGWEQTEARISARKIASRCSYDVLVFLGRRVAGVFDQRAEYHEWESYREGIAVCVPHPSGLNRLYNDETERVNLGETLRIAHAVSLHGWP